MNKNQQTVYAIKEILTLLSGLPPEIDEYSTINERLQIQSGVMPLPSEFPRLKVLMAGIGGHNTVPGVDGIGLTTPKDHSADDASLYIPQPLVLRPIDNDLTSSERAKYAFRKVEEHYGMNYYAYYGYRLQIDPSNSAVQMQKITTVEGGSPIVEPFIPSNANLFPVAPELPTTGAVTASNVSFRVTLLVKVYLDTAAVESFVDAMRIKYNGDERYAIMSEFALATGVDRIVEAEGSSGVFNFNEVVGGRVYGFAMEHKAVYYNTQELTLDFDLGNQIPQFATESIPTMQVII